MKIKLYLCGGEKPISEYPMGLGYLKSNCTGDIEIVDDSKKLKDCDLIGLSSNAWGLREAVWILNNTKIPVIIGGQGTLWSGLKNFPFKHIIQGEGEKALQAIIDNGQEKIAYHNSCDLDSLYYPDRGKCGPVIPILTSRGCPWHCAFCTSNRFWGKVRYHSPEYFIAEVSHILGRNPQVQTLYIMDDLFIANTSRFEKIHKLWMANGYNKELRLCGFIRSNIFTIDLARMMKEMGFLKVRFGAESGSNRILKLLNKGATVEDHQRAIDIAAQVGLPVSASFMRGIPGETAENLALTNAFIERNRGRLTVEGWYKFRPFPGTDLYKDEDPLKTDMRVR